MDGRTASKKTKTKKKKEEGGPWTLPLGRRDGLIDTAFPLLLSLFSLPLYLVVTLAINPMKLDYTYTQMSLVRKIDTCPLYYCLPHEEEGAYRGEITMPYR